MRAPRDLNTGDIGRLYSGRGEVALKLKGFRKGFKKGIVFTTSIFPEHMVNMVTGHGKMKKQCGEYKVSSVEVQKISNQFKTEVKPKENQAEVS
ncbi:MAG: hypothetical protein CM1200mP13_12170 [Candidatus Pelagibacterales bacterium]|nr:MAG: hypothetical protein CM1200mP13_12170 [Pelagibacterales bacterium]